MWVPFWVKGKEVETTVLKVQVTVASLVSSLGNEKLDCYLEMACPPPRPSPGSKILNVYAHAYTDINKRHPQLRLTQARDTGNI